MNGAFLTTDLFNLYVCFEVMLMASFVLLSLGGTRAQLEVGHIEPLELHRTPRREHFAYVRLVGEQGLDGRRDAVGVNRRPGGTVK